MTDAEQSQGNLQTIYEQICRAHDGIADFRAKLLALLPIASGAGIVLLLDADIANAKDHYFAIGIFGALISFGLYLYELRGIRRCNALIGCGKQIEKQMLVDLPASFSAMPDSVPRIVSNTNAAIVIYSTVIAGWVYIAFIHSNRMPAAIAAIGAFVVFVFFGLSVDWQQDGIQEKLPKAG